MNKKRSRTTFKVRMDEMINTLRHEISTGKYQIDEFLPSETQLVDMFSLSINSVRKALQVLVDEGLIQKIPKIGNKVIALPQTEYVTITFGYHISIEHIAELNDLLSEFEVIYPHIKVIPIKLSTIDYNEIVKNYMHNDMLDVVTIREKEMKVYEERGELELLESFTVDSGIYPFLRDIFSTKDALYAMPFVFSPLILCYNRDHFVRNNIPEPDSSWSWDDLIRAVQQLSDPPKRYGLYFDYLSEHRWPAFLLQSGMTFQRNEDGKVKLWGTKLMEAISKCKSIAMNNQYFPMYLGGQDNITESLFREEKVSVIMTTYFNLNHLRNSGISFEIAPLPHLDEQRTMILATGLAVNRHSKRKKAAQILVDFLMSEKAQLLIRKNTLSIPGLKKAAEWMGDENIYRPSRFNIFREIIPNFRMSTDLQLSTMEMDMLNEELKLYWSGMFDDLTFSERVEELL